MQKGQFNSFIENHVIYKTAIVLGSVINSTDRLSRIISYIVPTRSEIKESAITFNGLQFPYIYLYIYIIKCYSTFLLYIYTHTEMLKTV